MTAYRSGGGSKNPFADEEDDFSFGKSSSKGGGMGGGFESEERGAYGKDGIRSRYTTDEFHSEPLSRYEQLQQQKQNSMNSQLEATHRCMATIYDAERTGIETAEELMRQGEQLDNIETKTDKIIADTKVSQRHLNGIKSIFGGLKNWWSGEGKKVDAPQNPVQRDRSSSLLQQAIIRDQETGAGAGGGVHPALRLRSGNVRGFYDDDTVDYNPNDDMSFRAQRSTGFQRPTESSAVAPSQTSTASGFRDQKQDSGRSSDFQEYEKNLNKNLEMMSHGITNLKMLATGLGDEIENQNDQLENRIMPKVDRADIKIRDQNRQMRQILGK